MNDFASYRPTAFSPTGSTTPTRPLRSSRGSRPWEPAPYQLRAAHFLTTHYAAGLPLKPGARKTSITLKAFCDLKAAGKAQTMLVIAPLRTARQTWPAEIAKWEEFSHLRPIILHGKEKDERLKKAEGDVYLINPEGLFWLCNAYFGRPLPFDVVVIDELTRFKSAQSERSKKLRPRLVRGPRWRWGLTGSLAGDGDYLDVFGQQLMLDDGAALGRYITYYRDKFFVADYGGFNYTLKRGAEQEILERLAPYWFYMDPNDYTELPPIVDTPIMIDFDKDQMALYRRMRDSYMATLPGKVITAANAAAAYAKLSQMANGAVYDEDRKVHLIHDAKIDALDELVEELNGEPLLIGYEFNHDLARLDEWHKKRFDKPLPNLGSGNSPTVETQIIADWNNRRLPVLAAHPKSAGHGLNLQEGNAANVCWLSLPWSFESYDQFVRRVWRDGNASSRVFNHMLIIRGTIDEDKLAARDAKAFTQADLMRVLNDQILREERETRRGGGIRPFVENDEMVARLPRPGEAPAPVAQTPPRQAPAPGPQAAPAGWASPPAAAQTSHGWMAPGVVAAPPNGGAPAGWAQGETEQRERIRQQIAPTPQEQVSAAFGSAAQQQAGSIAGGDYGPVAAPAGWGAPAAAPASAPPPPSTAEQQPQGETARRGRRTNAQIAADEAAKAAAAPQQHDAVPTPWNAEAAVSAVMTARAECLKMAFADPSMPLEEGFEVADKLWAWLNKI